MSSYDQEKNLWRQLPNFHPNAVIPNKVDYANRFSEVPGVLRLLEFESGFFKKMIQKGLSL